MSEEQEVVERRTAVLTRKVQELSQGKNEIFLALIEAVEACKALEEIRIALDSGIDEDDYEEIVNQAIDAIVEYRVNREQRPTEAFEPFVMQANIVPQTFSTYDAYRLRYVVDANE
jgi:hypothetical protein